MVCNICRGETLHDVKTLMKAHCVAYEFQKYWLNGSTPTMPVVKFINEQCEHMLKDERLEEMSNRIPNITGYELFLISKTTFKSKINWGRLIAVLAFGIKLLNEETADMIRNWIVHVLLQNNVWVIFN